MEGQSSPRKQAKFGRRILFSIRCLMNTLPVYGAPRILGYLQLSLKRRLMPRFESLGELN